MPAYRELVFAGSRAAVQALFDGLAPLDPCFSELAGVRRESAAELLLEKLHLETEMTHVILREDEAARVVEALRHGAPVVALRANRAVREAWLDYRFRAFARRDAAAIRAALAALPAGLTAEETEAREEENPSAEGPELYAPLHAYIFAGRGRLRGGFGEILAARRALLEVGMLEADEIRLVVGEDAPGGR
jgi:hypothetical protein